ncbi:MAG: (Fe-S)-binding protein [Candidatus Thorarchaeota archaeon]|nr:(Fe-S)-binding protein [Candidatus Thorarchaeota archaeon]
MIDEDRIPGMVRMCAACPKMCRHACPTFFAWRSDAPTPHGRALLLHYDYKGTRPLDDRGIEILYQCLECSQCLTWCLPEIDVASIVENARKRIVQAKNAPEGLYEMANSIRSRHNPFNENHDNRTKWYKSAAAGKRRIAYFTGCTASYRESEIAKATVEVLQFLDYTVLVLDEEYCCGSPLFRTGFEDEGRETAQHNVDVFNALDVEEIVVTCPGCYRALTKDYARLGLEFNKPIRHISELLEQAAKDLPHGVLSEQVIYHDPCHLGRHLGVYEPPRKVICQLTGDNLVEFEKNRENAMCCGNGAGLRTLFSEKAKKIGSERIRQAKEIGANTLVTACPFCKNMLQSQTDKELEVLDLPELVTKALRIGKIPT